MDAARGGRAGGTGVRKPGSPRTGTTGTTSGRTATGTTATRRGGAAGSRTGAVSSRAGGGEEAATTPAASRPMSRVNSAGNCASGPGKSEALAAVERDPVSVFHTIEQIAALEATLWCILDGLKSNAPHVSFFCREYWGTSASHAMLSLEKLPFSERLKRQVKQAGVLESLALGVASHLCSGVMQDVSVTVRSRLRNLLYYVHENCLVLLDLSCQQWLTEAPAPAAADGSGHCPENLNFDILVGVKRYRSLRKGEHVMALRQHNDMIANVVKQLCRGAASKRPPVQRRGAASPGGPGDRSPGGRGAGGRTSQPAGALAAVDEILASSATLDRLRPCVIRSKVLQHMRFCPLLNFDGQDPDSPWPEEDPYDRYGSDSFSTNGPIIWFEPLPPMYPDLEVTAKLPPITNPETYTLVLDLDETLVHYYELNGTGTYGIRPGALEFLERMSQIGYELVIFTAATQDYADWVIDQIDPGRLIVHRLYRQHALPWGPIFIKDLSRLGRELDKVLIIDNIEENFRLQPRHGIFIYTWYDDPEDTALIALVPLLDELVATRVRVPDILEKYRDQIPTWAGFDQLSQMGGDLSELDQGADDAYYGAPNYAPQPEMQQPPQQQYTQPYAVVEPQGAVDTPYPVRDVPAAAAQQPFVGGYRQPAQQQPMNPPVPRMDAQQQDAKVAPIQQPLRQPQIQQQQQPLQQPQRQQPQQQQKPMNPAGPYQAPAPQQQRAAPAFSSAAGPYQAAAPQQRAAPAFSSVAGPYQAAQSRVGQQVQYRQ